MPTTTAAQAEYAIMEQLGDRVEVVRIIHLLQVVRMENGCEINFPPNQILPALNGSRDAVIRSNGLLEPARILSAPKAEVEFVQRPGNCHGRIDQSQILLLVENAEKAFRLASAANRGAKRAKTTSVVRQRRSSPFQLAGAAS